jgi:hypothetical protein
MGDKIERTYDEEIIRFITLMGQIKSKEADKQASWRNVAEAIRLIVMMQFGIL